MLEAYAIKRHLRQTLVYRDRVGCAVTGSGQANWEEFLDLAADNGNSAEAGFFLAIRRKSLTHFGRGPFIL